MAERLRSIDVQVVVDTNKDTRRKTLQAHEDESVRAFADRVRRTILTLAGVGSDD